MALDSCVALWTSRTQLQRQRAERPISNSDSKVPHSRQAAPRPGAVAPGWAGACAGAEGLFPFCSLFFLLLTTAFLPKGLSEYSVQPYTLHGSALRYQGRSARPAKGSADTRERSLRARCTFPRPRFRAPRGLGRRQGPHRRAVRPSRELPKELQEAAWRP